MDKKVILLFLIFFSTGTFGCYSGLLVIPTADFSGNGNVIIDLQWEGWADQLREKQSIVNTEFGIGDKFEFGFDFNLKETDHEHSVLFNVKYLILKSEDSFIKVALGTYNLNSELDCIPYLIATIDFGFLRTHCGVQREYDGEINYILGIDKITESGFQFCADKMSGKENYLSVGVGFSKGKYSTMVGYQWPNGGGKPEIVIHLIFAL